MKKIIWIFIAIAIIVLSFLYGYFTYKKNSDTILSQNAEYERYLNKEIYGADLATIINKVIDNNETYAIDKDNKGKYIDDNKNSIKLDVKIIDNNTIYDVETIYNGGVENFIRFYNTIKFKCVDIKYHKETQKVKYLLFEQISK
ncbi:MAG: hypothetical protein IKF83_03020 [Clostridia bacterium]|nr:hypothetical protein [Clostridia bacterium]